MVYLDVDTLSGKAPEYRCDADLEWNTKILDILESGMALLIVFI